MPIRRLLLSIALLLWSGHLSRIEANEPAFRIEVSAGGVPRRNTPVAIDVSVPEASAKITTAMLVAEDGTRIPGQLTAADPASDVARRLEFILPKLDADATAAYSVQLSDEVTASATPADVVFRWVDTSHAKEEQDAADEASRELRLGERPVVRFMHSPLDERTSAARSATFKPYHHVYDPEGRRYLTKGPGGIFPHHRGLFFGFSRISYGDGKQADVWHNAKGESQRYVETVAEEAGPVLGRHTVRITWHGRDGEAFAEETRSLTAFDVPDGTLLEWSTRLQSLAGPIRLDGDPQHAGFHFRATQDVPDKTSKQTYYLRPDGKGTPGSYRNWPGQREHVNLEWLAVSFVVDESRYTCCYLDRPSNPKESRFSERDYGRFGSYFEYEMAPEKTLELAYRIWLQRGEMEVRGIAALARDFVDPPVAKVVP